MLKKYPNLIPLVLSALSLDDEELIQKIFETLTDFLESKKVMQPHLELIVNAAIGVSKATNLSFNVREVTIHFLEEIGDSFGKYMAKKSMTALIQSIIETGFVLAAESEEDFADDEESPHTLAMYMLYNFASEVPNPTIYPIFKALVLQYCAHPDPLYRRAGLKVLGHVCDSDALLDNIKDDIEEITNLVIAGLLDQTLEVKEGAAVVVGQFSDNVVPEFLELSSKVIPCLF